MKPKLNAHPFQEDETAVQKRMLHHVSISIHPKTVVPPIKPSQEDDMIVRALSESNRRNAVHPQTVKATFGLHEDVTTAQTMNDQGNVMMWTKSNPNRDTTAQVRALRMTEVHRGETDERTNQILERKTGRQTTRIERIEVLTKVEGIATTNRHRRTKMIGGILTKVVEVMKNVAQEMKTKHDAWEINRMTEEKTMISQDLELGKTKDSLALETKRMKLPRLTIDIHAIKQLRRMILMVKTEGITNPKEGIQTES